MRLSALTADLQRVFSMTAMRILVAHNQYHYRGGEDTVVDAEVALLRQHGHEVEVYRRDNAELAAMSPPSAALSTLWSRRTLDDLAHLVDGFAPDLVHAHNTFPLISPSLHAGARRHRLPVIQTLHNFRLVCPQAMLVRRGRSCTDCVGRLPWPGVLHRCYRQSFMQTSTVAAMLVMHRLRRTWQRDVTRFIALNQMCRDIFTEGGLPMDKLVIKPNFVVAHCTPDWEQRSGGVFIGRLAEEKGLDVLAQALQQLPGQRIAVYGKGPLQSMVMQSPGLDFRGFQTPEVLARRMHAAAYLVMPSTGVESFGLVAVEAFAAGTPVIASRQGGLLELIVHGKTGLLVEPGNASALAQAIRYAETHPEQMRAMGRAAWESYLANYTPERNYAQLMHIYQQAIAASPLPDPPSLAYDYQDYPGL